MSDTPQTRCDALPQPIGDDLALVLFWLQHYAPTDEQTAAERLIDYFAEPVDDLTAALRAVEQERDEWKRQYESINMWADERTRERDALRVRVAELEACADPEALTIVYSKGYADAQQWERVPDGEYPMVTNAMDDNEFLYIHGNTDDSICTHVECGTEAVMLDLPMKIMRRKGGNDGE